MSPQKTWILIRCLVASLVVLTLSPLVIPQQIKDPEWLGMPYTLWTGILITVLIVLLTWWGAKVQRSLNHK